MGGSGSSTAGPVTSPAEEDAIEGAGAEGAIEGDSEAKGAVSKAPGTGTMLTSGRLSSTCGVASLEAVEPVPCSCWSSSEDSERNSLHGSIPSGPAPESAVERPSCDRSVAIVQKPRVIPRR